MAKKKSELNEIGCVIVLNMGVVHSVRTFTDANDAETVFAEEARKIENDIYPYEDIHIDGGCYDNMAGQEVVISWS